jgi:hypothetical protein
MFPIAMKQKFTKFNEQGEPVESVVTYKFEPIEDEVSGEEYSRALAEMASRWLPFPWRTAFKTIGYKP